MGGVRGPGNGRGEVALGGRGEMAWGGRGEGAWLGGLGWEG